MDNNTSVELAVVAGETSGLWSFNEKTQVLSLAEDMTFEQWKIVLKTIKVIKKYYDVAASDCYAYGVKKWGKDKVDEALEQLEFETTLVKAAIAINTVPQELRLENLEGDHYVELAKAQLPKAKAIRWARIASEQRLTPSQLRFSIVEGEVVDRAAAKGLHTGVYTVQGVRQAFDVWSRRVGGIEGVKQMDLDHQVEILEEIGAICEFAMQLHEHLKSLQEVPA